MAVARTYRLIHLDWIGRRVVRLCCDAFSAGAGLDDAAFEVLQPMGQDAVRLLNEEVQRGTPYRRRIAELYLKWFEAKPTRKQGG